MQGHWLLNVKVWDEVPMLCICCAPEFWIRATHIAAPTPFLVCWEASSLCIVYYYMHAVGTGYWLSVKSLTTKVEDTSLIPFIRKIWNAGIFLKKDRTSYLYFASVLISFENNMFVFLRNKEYISY